MHKKTVAMTLTPSGEIVDNYEKCKGLKLMDDAMIVYHLISSANDVEYFKNKMLQGFAIPKELHPCS